MRHGNWNIALTAGYGCMCVYQVSLNQYSKPLHATRWYPQPTDRLTDRPVHSPIGTQTACVLRDDDSIWIQKRISLAWWTRKRDCTDEWVPNQLYRTRENTKRKRRASERASYEGRVKLQWSKRPPLSCYCCQLLQVFRWRLSTGAYPRERERQAPPSTSSSSSCILYSKKRSMQGGNSSISLCLLVLSTKLFTTWLDSTRLAKGQKRRESVGLLLFWISFGYAINPSSLLTAIVFHHHF